MRGIIAKPKIIIPLCAVLIILLAVIVVLYAKNITAKELNTIGKDNAKEISLQDARVNGENVSFTKSSLKKEKGIQVYEIAFYTETRKYDYKIAAESGSIYSSEISKFEGQKKKKDNNVNQEMKWIGTKKAKSIALNNAKLKKSEVNFEKANLEREGKVYVYNIKFKKKKKEYEYKINSTKGNIIEASLNVFEGTTGYGDDSIIRDTGNEK